MRILMWFALGFGGACALGAYGLTGKLWLLCGLAALLGLSLAAAGWRWKPCRPAAVAALGCAVGFVWFWGFQSRVLEPLQAWDGQTVSMEVRALDYSYETDYGIAVDGTAVLDGRRCQVRLYLNTQEEITPGDRISGTFSCQTVSGETASYYQSKGIFLRAKQAGVVAITPEQPGLREYPAVWRRALKTRLDALFPADTAGFAQALLLGDTTGLDYETKTELTVSGIRHVVAVSGLHVSILFSMVYVLSGRRWGAAAVLGVPVLVLFAAVTGFSPSVTRACIMQLLMVLSMLLSKEYDTPTALSFAALVMLAANPLVITSASFQLSVGAVAGITLFSGRISMWILSDRCLGEVRGMSLRIRLLRGLVSTVSVTLSVLALTMPLCAAWFGMVSLIGVVTNLLTLPLISLIFYGVLLSLAGSFLWLPLGKGIAAGTGYLIRWVLAVSGALSKVPLAAVYTESVYIIAWMVFVYLLLGVFLLSRKKRPGLLAACCCLGLCGALLASWAEPLTDGRVLTALDVGQGQCLILQDGGRTYLVDCGGDSGEHAADLAAGTLLSQGISHLDGVILTHYDADHSGGLSCLLSRISTDALFLPDAQDENGVADALAAMTDGEVFLVGEDLTLTWETAEMTIYAPSLTNSSNDSSLAVLFQTESCGILITGDRSDFGERQLLRQGCTADVDVLVVGHHGSASSTCEALLTAVTPEVVVISVGKDNPYGHPGIQTLTRLTQAGCDIFRTDRDGTILYRR